MSDDNENLPAERPDEPLKSPVPRDSKGRFIKGFGGNPSGRTKGVKNYIKEIQTAHEAALREYMAEPKQQAKVLKGLDNVFRIMQEGEDNHAVAAAKLVFSTLMPKGSSSDDGEGQKTQGVINIVIETPDGQQRPSGVIIQQPKVEDDDEEGQADT